MTTSEEIQEEEERMRFLKIIVDLTAAVLEQGQLSRGEALDLVHATKRKVMQLFPDKEAVYELIYKPRFERLLRKSIWKEFLSISENSRN